jgi:hypothetical protein
VWYILFFIWWQFERCGIFCFSFHRSNCHKMKNKIYNTVRIVIKWKTKYTTPFENAIKWKTKYTTPFELSFYNCSNGVVYFVFHYMTVERCGIFSFTFYNSSNGVVYFVFHFITVRYNTVPIVIKWKTKYTTPFENAIKWKTKYTTPFELSWNEKQNIPHRSNHYKM